MRLLAVEDDPVIRKDVQAALQASGFHVETAEDGEDAWFLGDTEDYDLVVLDLETARHGRPQRPETLARQWP